MKMCFSSQNLDTGLARNNGVEWNLFVLVPDVEF